MSELDPIYSMKLNERITHNSGEYEVRRVPGGWVYRFFMFYCESCESDHAGDYRVDSVFIPFNKEFQGGP